MRHLSRVVSLSVSAVALVGCVSSEPRVSTVPPSAWRAAADSPRTSEPVQVHRDPVRQRSQHALTRDEVLDLANRRDPQDAIVEIDRHPLAFQLTNQNIMWFEDRVTPPELVDYLRKRAAVDWEALNTPPPVTEQPSYAEWQQSPEPAPQPPTTYVVQSPQPPSVVYERTVYLDSYYGGPGYYNPPAYCGPTYCGPSGAVYVGGTVTYGGYGRSYVHSRPTYYAPRTSYVYPQNSLTYRPGVPSGVFAHPNTVSTNTVVRTGNPTVVVQSRGGRGGRGR